MTRPDAPLPITVYGIPNCDTVKRARAWLAERGVAYVFHDFKKSGLPREQWPAWAAALGWARLINRQGTAWRKLEQARQAAVVDDGSALALACEVPSVVKRPVVRWADGSVTIGFVPEQWARLC